MSAHQPYRKGQRMPGSAGGTALFEKDGVPIGVAQVYALVPGTPVTPYVGVMGRATANPRSVMDTEYVTVDRLRA